MAFDFTLTDRVRDWQGRIRDFVDRVVIPCEQQAFADGLTDRLRLQLQAQARSAGLWAPQAKAALGGGGFRFDEAAVLLEEAGRSLLGPLAINAAAPDEGNLHLLAEVATAAQQERFLRPLAAGQVRSCFAMTEPPPGAGSDPAALRTTATRAGRGWVIRGDKHLITGADGAAFAIVMAANADVQREYRVMSALAATPVPVPATIACCADHAVLGAPFYLMDEVPGTVLRAPADTQALTAGQRHQVSTALVDALSALHAVDPGSVGLADFGRQGGYATRQLRTWGTQWQRSATRDLPDLERLLSRLADAVPTDEETTIVHGDYRLDNTIVTLTPQPKIAAVLDWELATLGEPLADLATLPRRPVGRRGLRPRRPRRPAPRREHPELGCDPTGP